MAASLPLQKTLSEAYASAKRLTEPLTLARVPEGLGPLLPGLLLAEMAAKPETAARPADLVIVARDSERLAEYRETLRFTLPGVETLEFPAWDCLPFDRASPSPLIQSRRTEALAALCSPRSSDPRVLLTTINACVQRLPLRARVRELCLKLKPGQVIPMEDLVSWLERGGYHRTSTVRDLGDYAVRGGLIDLWPAGKKHGLRLDFFGDSLESIRAFDPETQLSTGQLHELSLLPSGELNLDEDSIARFRKAYVSLYGTVGGDDLLYQAVREGRRIPGMEHWLPFFLEGMETLFDHVELAPIVFDHLAMQAIEARLETIGDHHGARMEAIKEKRAGMVYRPVPLEALYLDMEELKTALGSRTSMALDAFSPSENSETVRDLEGRVGRSFLPERTAGENLFDAMTDHAAACRAQKKRVLMACWSEGSRERLTAMLQDHELKGLVSVDSLREALAFPRNQVGMTVLALHHGAEIGDLVIVTEQDLLGERALAGRRRKRKASDALTEASHLTPGDYVVHVDNGIGQFLGLKVLEALGVPHECLEIQYDGSGKLFLPVENIELLSRYGSEDTVVHLDKLGGVAWQSRKAKLKKRIHDMAKKLIDIAAARLLRSGVRVTPPEGIYEEFVARFPFEETEDQERAIEAIVDDLSSGRPMDRLVCGDVGFGKTEVGLRAAFLMALSGRQVAVVVPTTLLAKQHYATFTERFKGLPVRIAQLSRFTPPKDRKQVLADIQSGQVDIVVGTHALLAKSIKFAELGLLIIDEEQHFGVTHKERLKNLRAEVHVLTLTATPIPRTLQLALTGVRDLSLIATPPVDRLAVRTFIAPFDELAVREAILREHYRNGQTFFVCPRIADLGRMESYIQEVVPEVKVAVAHGQMPAEELEDIVNHFYEGRYNVLLSTNIVESGLDIPNANTLIVYRADRFGLAQLYQLRGRVGRSKVRAFSLFTTPAEHLPTKQATKRLEVLQSLDTLGAGFQLASHDLDLRGAGNLLGDEQSGHIKEVGYELYQHMLEEAVAELKSAGDYQGGDNSAWSPTITLGISVIIPDFYIPDHDARMAVYRDLAALTQQEEVEAYAAGIRDRFGPIPDEVENLLKIIIIKCYCRTAQVDRIDAGPNGILIGFYQNTFEDPGGLIRLIEDDGVGAKFRPDHRVFFKRSLRPGQPTVAAALTMVVKLARLAEGARTLQNKQVQSAAL